MTTIIWLVVVIWAVSAVLYCRSMSDWLRDNEERLINEDATLSAFGCVPRFYRWITLAVVAVAAPFFLVVNAGNAVYRLWLKTSIWWLTRQVTRLISRNQQLRRETKEILLKHVKEISRG